jgi:transcriptional regulator with XRE-family HTH domain
MRNWIKDRLKELGYLQQELADVLCLPHTRITDIVYGRRSVKITELRRFADFLEMSIEEVLTRFEKE